MISGTLVQTADAMRTYGETPVLACSRIMFVLQVLVTGKVQNSVIAACVWLYAVCMFNP